mgnify:CR=1 FL=1
MQTTYKYWTILDLAYCIYQFDNMEDAEQFEELAEKRYDQWGTHYEIKLLHHYYYKINKLY